ncbi:MAG: sigma-70 family RNA polymerase sigma factor [Akkermansiaceae bacterium]|nr:sigma-70 family RNA polymerase sigma factor [Akkermansiaceae bacterium]
MNILRKIASNGVKTPVPPDSAQGGGMASGSKNTQKSDGNGSPDNRRIKSSDIASEDAIWVAEAQAGDMRAFDRLVSKHRGKIYAMIYNMVKNDADAWDLSQEAFIKAWKALPKFESRARFSTWLFRISHNVVYDWLRKRRIEGDGELNDEVFDTSRVDPGASTMPHHNAPPDEAMQQNELCEEINAAIAGLSEGHREVILLREVQGLDYKEIAEITGNTIGTVMSRLHYARKKLQSILKPDAD